MSISIHVPSWGTTGSGRIHCQAAGNFNPRSLVGNDGKDSGQEKGGYISIHVPSWGTTMEKPLSYPNQQISIHVPSWGTTRSLFDLPFPLPISIHVPSWGTTSMLAGCGKAYPFQSTFPRGERHSAMRNFRSDSYFNPRSLVGNDQSQSSLLLIQEISIHVPSWGTTAEPLLDHRYRAISIHVPSWGTT